MSYIKSVSILDLGFEIWEIRFEKFLVSLRDGKAENIFVKWWCKINPERGK